MSELTAPAAGVYTILLVEDDELVMETTRSILEHSGYTVVSTFLPSVALELARQGNLSIDLLLTDVVMPQMNGPELYRRLKELLPGLPAMFMSGYSSDAIHGIMQDNMAAFLAKPFTTAKLLAAIRSHRLLSDRWVS